MCVCVCVCDISSLRVNGPSEPGRLRDVCVCQWVKVKRCDFIICNIELRSMTHSSRPCPFVTLGSGYLATLPFFICQNCRNLSVEPNARGLNFAYGYCSSILTKRYVS